MEITLMVNGKQVKATVDEQEMKEAMGEKEQKKTRYEKIPTAYFYHSPDGVVRIARVTNDSSSVESASNSYNSGNFYSLHEVARNNARADNLMRKLRRFAAEHGGCVAPKQVRESKKFILFYNKDVGMIEHSGFYHPGCNEIAFASVEAAKAAIEEFKDELIWYFTEYDPMPEGWWET